MVINKLVADAVFMKRSVWYVKIAVKNHIRNRPACF